MSALFPFARSRPAPNRGRPRMCCASSSPTDAVAPARRTSSSPGRMWSYPVGPGRCIVYNSYLIETDGEIAGIVVRSGQSFRFHAVGPISRNWNSRVLPRRGRRSVPPPYCSDRGAGGRANAAADAHPKG